jgi:hypothetical protein
MKPDLISLNSLKSQDRSFAGSGASFYDERTNREHMNGAVDILAIARAKLAEFGKRERELSELSESKSAPLTNAQPTHGHMPAGVGVCPACSEVRWLCAGPTTTVCDPCAVLLADDAEITARGELR